MSLEYNEHVGTEGGQNLCTREEVTIRRESGVREEGTDLEGDANLGLTENARRRPVRIPTDSKTVEGIRED